MKKYQIILFIPLTATLVVSCSGINNPFSFGRKVTVTPTMISNTATAIPPRQLTICLSEEPASLYLYTEQQSASMWSVLEAIYDGPIDINTGAVSPVILEKIPSYEDGDLVKIAIPVSEGDLIVNASNQIVNLERGVELLPAGCQDRECAISWDGSSEIEMDQISATFRLRSGIRWSDGTPLTSDDSIYSFELAGNSPGNPFSERKDLTHSYEKLDDLSLRWTALPGYSSVMIQTMYWLPLPMHLLADIPANQLASSDLASRAPLGWGPYQILEWQPGDHIRLSRNEAYYRASEGLPEFDQLEFRFIGRDDRVSAFTLQQCDLADVTSIYFTDPYENDDSDVSDDVKKVWQAGPEIIELILGINPASYDDGYNPAFDRPDFFGDKRVRQAVAACINFQTMNQQIFNGHAGHARISQLVGNQSDAGVGDEITFEPIFAGQLLDEVGWKDEDLDPKTPRVAFNISGVPAGTALALTLSIPEDPVSAEIATLIAESAESCGIKVEVLPKTFDELYAPGPNGTIFGRTFDLVLITWQYSLEPACERYTTSQVPGSGNFWIGANISGYVNPMFDGYCNQMQHAIPGDGKFESALQRATDLFLEEMPAIPIFLIPKSILIRSDLCDVNFDLGSRSVMRNLELFRISDHCRP